MLTPLMSLAFLAPLSKLTLSITSRLSTSGAPPSPVPSSPPLRDPTCAMTGLDGALCLKVQPGHCILADKLSYYTVCDELNGTVYKKATPDCALFDCKLGNFSALQYINMPNESLAVCESGGARGGVLRFDSAWTFFIVLSVTVAAVAGLGR